MIIPNETLYYFAVVFYILLFFMQLIKKRYKLFQMIVFFFAYAGIVAALKLCLFPLMIGETGFQNELFFAPFSTLAAVRSGAPVADGLVWQRYLALVVIAAFLGFALPVLSKKPRLLSTLLTAELFLLPTEVGCILMAQIGSSYKLLDTSIFLLQPAALGVGYLLYAILERKTKLRSLCKEA